MDKLKKYQQRKALAETNYQTRLSEAKRQMGEAFEIYQNDLKEALEEYQSPTKG